MMEEDIKILEEYTEKDIPCDSCRYCSERPKVSKAIRNLIAKNKELKEIVKTYNAISNEYMPNDIKIVIADIEYFNNGILKENLIPKSKVKEKIEWLEKISDNGINAVRFAGAYEDEIKRIERQKNISTMISILQELLED